jgi:hypothetical protein
MATRAELQAEAYRRGVMPADQAAVYEEAVRRGVVRDDFAKGKQARGGMATFNAFVPGFDEIAAGTSAGISTLRGKGSFGQNWQAERNFQEGQKAGLAERNPVGANLTIGLGYALQAIPALLSGGSTAAPQAVASGGLFGGLKRRGLTAAKNATTASLYGFGNAAADKGTGTERLKAANAAILPSAAAGVIAPAVLATPRIALNSAPVRTVVRAANNTVSRVGGKGFLNPQTEAFRVIGESLKKDGFTAEQIQRAAIEWQRVGGPSPAFVDLISKGGRGQRTLSLIRGSAMTGGGKEEAVKYIDKVAADLQDSAIARTRELTPEQRSVADVAAGLRAERANAANVDYAAPYRTPVVVGDTINDALSGEPGRAALRRARAAAVARRNTEQVAEIDALLAANPPAGGVIKLPPTIAPEAPLPVEDPRGRSLLTFLRQQGGLKDTGGDLKAMDLARDRGRFQKDNIVNPNGIDLDDAAQRAWEAGYFPNAKAPRGADYADNYNPVSRDDLLEAIRREAAGRPPPASWLQEEDLAASTRWMDDAPDFPEFGDDWWRSLEGDGAKRVSAGTLDRVRIAMAGRGAKMNQSPDTRDIASGLFQRSNDIDAALASIPEIAPARAAYRGSSNKIEGVEKVGPSVLTSTPSLFAADVARLGPESQPFVGVGSARALEEAIGKPAENSTGVLNRISTATNPGRNLSATYGADTARDYQQSIAQMVDQVKTARYIDPNTNSQTAGRIADQSLVEGVLNFPKTPMGWAMSALEKFQRGATLNDAERQAIVEIATGRISGAAPEGIQRALAPRPPQVIPGAPAVPITAGLIYGRQENRR